MPKTPIPFLQLIHDEAEESEYLAIDLPDQQGIVVLPQDLSAQQHIDLLRRVIVNLGAVPPSTVTPEPSLEQAEIDCQVTVEERAQLFNFLHSSN